MIPQVAEYMTKNPYSIPSDQDVGKAHALMRERHIRHLPVTKDHALVGIVSLGDLDLLQAYVDTASKRLTVADAMTPDPYCVLETSDLAAVSQAMAERRLGSAIVVDAERNVVGIFTAVDALRVLAATLRL